MTECPICKSSERSVLFVLNWMRILQCVTCGLVSGHQLHSDVLITECYDTNYFTSRPQYREYIGKEVPMRREAARAMIDIFSGFLGRAATEDLEFLDFGSGAGFLTDAASRRGFRATGVDISPEATALARTLGAGRYETGDLASLDRWNSSFDMVTIVDTLEHVEDPVHALRGLSRVLATGGKLFISVPGWGGWMSTQQGDDYYHYTTDHRWFFSDKTLAATVQRAGLALVHVGPLAKLFQESAWRLTEAGDKYIHRRDHIVAVASIADH